MQRDKLPPGAQEWHLRDHPGQAAAGTQAQKLAILRKQSPGHERNRLGAVAETLAMVGVLAQNKVLSGYEVVTVRGAKFQWVSGESGVVGAHCLPGWLSFNGAMIHESPSWTPELLQQHGIKALPFDRKLWNLGGMVDLVDATLNKADSDLERLSGARGLKSAFARSTQLLMTKLAHRNSDRWETVAELVADATHHYRSQAVYICEERLDWYDDKLTKTLDQTAADALKAKSSVVVDYLGEVQNRAFTPTAATASGFGSILRDVLKH
jgi:hypothetical protein